MNLHGLKVKLLFQLGFLALGILMVGLLGFISITKLGNNMERVIENSLPIVRTVALIDMIHDGVRGSVLEATLGVQRQDKVLIESAQNSLDEHKTSLESYFKILFSKEFDLNLKRKLNDNYKEIKLYLDSAQKVISSAQNDQSHLIEYKNDFEMKFEHLEKSLKDFGDELDEKNKIYFTNVVNEGQLYKKYEISVLALTLLLGFIISFWISKKLISSLSDISSKLSQEAKDLGISSLKVNEAAQSLSSSAQQQASVLEETSSAVEEISAMVKKSSSVANQAEEALKSSIENANKGTQIVQLMTQSIEKIVSTNDEIGQYMNENNIKIKDILNIIKEINTKTKIINDIVFQTKILSFNASVESARAGEHGKGFSVVAEEVGNLAQMSGNAAKEINILLDNSLTKVSKIIEDTKLKVDSMLLNAKTTVEEGAKVTFDCGTVLKNIISESKSISQLVSNITQSNRESSKGVEEIAKAMHLLNSTTHSNTQSARSSAEYSKDLSTQMEHLKTVASGLDYIIFGKDIIREN